MSWWKKTALIVWKDVVVELRTREMAGSMLVFSLLVMVIFNLAFDLRVTRVLQVLPGVIWVTFAFAGTLQLNHALAIEMEETRMEGLLLAPMERSAIYWGKAFGNWLFITAIEAVVLPLFSALFNVNLLQPLLLLVVLLGTAGFAAVGTLLSVIAVNTRAREVLLPVLLFPIVLPVVISSVRLTAGVLDGVPPVDLAGWWRFLIGFDIIFAVLSYLLFDFVVES